MAGTIPGHPGRTMQRVGFNPFQRRRRRSAADIVLVVVTIAIAAALVVWAAVSG